MSNLDRPWHETPFPLQGFYIQSDEDAKVLAEYCREVYIDVKRQRLKHRHSQHAVSQTKVSSPKVINLADQAMLKLPPINVKTPEHYVANSTIKKEVSRVRKLHLHVYEAIDSVFSALESGATISLQETEKVAAGMVESVIRNPDALVWLAKMHQQDAHGYRHSINASIWALVFGRHLGLKRSLLKSLALGVLLAHVGKANLQIDALSSSERERLNMLDEDTSYVMQSVAMLQDLDAISPAVLAIVQFHQERHNGSGFPNGVTGDKIPLLAKIAGLVDYYQGLIYPRESRLGLSPLEAVSRLYELRNIAFQADLVERFIEAVGVYPTGTLVELSSEEVGIVTGHNEERRLQPKVLVVLDENKALLKAGKVLDLMTWNQQRTEAEAIYIRDSLPKGAYDIDETEYLLTGAKSRWTWTHLKGSLAAS